MNFLVTAGPTHEPIDPVRFIGNRSSGKMGYAIAEAALARRHTVTLISGPVWLAPPEGARLVRVTTAEEMLRAVHSHLAGIDALVMAAAVADYTPASVAREKIKKSGAAFALELVPTRDILKSLPSPPRKFLVIGFAAETRDVARYARKKLAEKKCDAVIANDVSRMDTGFESDWNEIEMFFSDHTSHRFPPAPKRGLGVALIKKIEGMQENLLTKK